jgi:hypothetical protein
MYLHRLKVVLGKTLASNGAATVPSYNAGSLNFAASQVAFHTLGGVPFTVTYTVDAVAKSLTK